MVNEFDLTIDADDAGQVFRGQCAELCGTGHRIMTFDVTVWPRTPSSRPGTTRRSSRPSSPATATERRAGRVRRPPPPAARSSNVSRRASSSTSTQLRRRPTRRSRSISTTRTPARPTTSTSSTRRRRRSSTAKDFNGVAVEDYAVPPLAAGELHVRVLDPPEPHERHADGPVRSIDGDHHAHAAATAYRSGLYEWVTTTDHKRIGILYIVNSFIFFFLGGLLALVVRTELAQPGIQFLTDEGLYNQLFTMHGSVMIFLFIIPMLAGFGNYVVRSRSARRTWRSPDQRAVVLDAAARRHPAVPRVRDRRRGLGRLDELHAAVGGPAARLARRRQDLWLMGLTLIGTSSILGAVNFLVTIFKMRAPGMTLFRMPILVWTVMVTSILVPDGDAGLHQRADHAVHRPQPRRPLLRPAVRRQRDPLAERLLVLLAPRRLRHGPAGDGHRQRGPAGLQPQAAVRLQGVRLRDGRHRRPRASRSGPTTCSRPARSSCRSSA